VVKVSQVLLVEDNPIMCRFIASALSAQDIRVTQAHTGAQALGLWASGGGDLILQDTVLPDMDGFELVARLRDLPGGADVPILAVSGLLSASEEARISAVGFSDVIIKPLESGRLRQVVRAHLPRNGASPPRFGEGRRVLLVDDDAIQSKLIAFRLSRLGFDVVFASDGLEALRKARELPPDAIVSDIMMPVLDGFGLCAAVRRDPALARIPLVLMTNSYVDEPDRQLARAAGADQFVIRTPALLEVVEALRSSLSGHGLQRQTSEATPGTLEKVWTTRVVSQLERQVAINAGMAQHSAILSAELTVLRGISDALSNRQDIRAALHDVVEACIDAGSFSLGLLHVPHESPPLRLAFGRWEGWSDDATDGLLERANGALRKAGANSLWLATPAALRELSPVLEQSDVKAAAIIRVTRGDSVLGTLLMTSKLSSASQERLAFLEAVAAQIAQALTLARAFADKEASERRATEQANVLRSVLETVAEGVVVTDSNGDFLLWNPAAESILGTGSVRVPAREWPERFGLSFADSMLRVPSEQVPLVRALAGEVVDERQAYQIDDAAARAPKHVTISARPLDRGGSVSGAVAVLRDITEEKATQTRLLVADRMASIGMLAAGVAHEINNPLAAVVANLEMAATALQKLLHKPQAPAELGELAKMLDEANEAGARVRRIVADLRVFARAEADVTGAVNIHEVLESVLRLAKNDLRHRARVVHEYAADVRFVEGNESRLSQVFLNLVMNAVQALPTGQAEKNEIRIRTRAAPNGRVVITVADTGDGISADAMQRLFVPFFTTKAVGLGTGLGLSICQRLVTACGGEIHAESRPGEGATFHVTLRAAAQPAPEARVPAPAEPDREPSSRRGKILMIDDEPVILNILTRALGERHDCASTTRASDALARLRAGEHFDLILCDLMMPAMDGKEFHVQLSQFAPEHARRMVFLTGGAFTPALQAFLAEVPNERINKPFDVARLKSSINERLRDLPASH
jgi:PAS domain S-box-containing protein